MNTRCRWVVENFTHESSYQDLVKAIKKAGCELQEIKGEFKYEDVAQYDEKAPIIFFGSIGMTSLIQSRLTHSYPVAYCTQKNYLCTQYMSHFGKYLFNDRYAIVSLAELKRNLFYYYGIFGKECIIFVRPDSGQKPFQAQLVDMQDFENFYKQGPPHDLVVVSTPKTIRGEWRFVVTSKQEIIACSTYRYQGQICKIPSAPQGATDLVKEMLKVGYYPDSIFVMDVCEDSDGNYWLLELNSFSSAGLYECKKDIIVERVSQIAEEEWEVWRKISFLQPD